MITKYDNLFLDIAESFSKMSYANKKKVGAIIVKDNSIISDGYNGTPSGYCNECEDSEGNTHWYVLHAEANAITKISRMNLANQKEIYTLAGFIESFNNIKNKLTNSINN